MGNQIYTIVKKQNLLFDNGQLIACKHADDTSDYYFSIAPCDKKNFDQHKIYQANYTGLIISTHDTSKQHEDLALKRTLEAVQFMIKNWKIELFDIHDKAIEQHTFNKWYDWMQKHDNQDIS